MSDIVIFDLFHTLVSPEDHWPAQFNREFAAADALGADPRSLARFWDTSGQARYAGRPVAQLLAAAAQDQEMAPTEDAIRTALEIYGRYHDLALGSPRPDVIEGLQGLRQAGCRLALLSNADDREVAAWNASPLADLIPTVCFSYAIGVAKPDPAAYSIVMERLSADPPSVVFVGDGGGREFEGARQAGIGRIICVTGFGTADGLRKHEAIREASALADTVIPSVADLPAVLSE